MKIRTRVWDARVGLWIKIFCRTEFSTTKKSQDVGPSSSTSNGKQAEERDEDDIHIDDDLDLDELNELEASLSRTSIQIREPGVGTSS
jgi:hypothetical protein